MEYLNVKQLKKVLGVSRGTIENNMKKGMPFIKLGERVLRFDEMEVKEWISEKRSVRKCQ